MNTLFRMRLCQRMFPETLGAEEQGIYGYGEFWESPKERVGRIGLELRTLPGLAKISRG